MNGPRRMMLVAAIGTLVVFVGGASAEADGALELQFRSAGGGLALAYGDWGVYTAAWSQPRWSLDYDAVLAGYGEWVWVDGLGRVWRPWVQAGWQPFTYGRWVVTTYGWTWVAYEPWGYFPHHYGSWALTAFGWVWAPGFTYHAAGVVWVRAGSYVGWYAAPPRGWCHADHGFRAGYNRSYRDVYDHGYDDGWRDARYATFVPWKNFGSDNVSHYRVSHSLASRARVETLGHPPTAREVTQRGGVPVVETRLATRAAEVGGHTILLARPEGVAASVQRYAPETVRGTLSAAALDAHRSGGRAQTPVIRDLGIRTGDNAIRQSPATRSPSWTNGRPEERALQAEPRSFEARGAQQPPDSRYKQHEEWKPSARAGSRFSAQAAPPVPVAEDSRASADRSPTLVVAPTTGIQRGAAVRPVPGARFGGTGDAGAEEQRTSDATRRAPSRKASSSEEKAGNPRGDGAPRRTGARRR